MALEPSTNEAETVVDTVDPAVAVTPVVTDDKAAAPPSGVEPSKPEAKAEGDAPKTPIEAAKAGLAKLKPVGQSSSQKAPDPAAKPEEAVPNKDVPKADADKDLPFHNHPRWKEVQADRAALKPRAENWDRFEAKLRETGIGHEDVTALLDGGTRLNRAGVTSDERHVLFDFAYYVKTDPAKAYEIVEPIFNALRQAVGVELPEDLRKQVDEGEITEDAARRLAKSEATARIAETKAKRTTDESRADQDARAAADLETRIISAATGWEGRQRSDPDWTAKEKRVVRQIGLLRAAKPPRTPEEAVALCDEALAMVNEDWREMAPRKPEIRPQTASGSTTRAAPEPTTPIEAARQALERMRAA